MGAVDVVVGAVGGVGELLHEHVVERPEPHADGGEADVGAVADLPEDVVGAGGTHVGDTVGEQHHQHVPPAVSLRQRHVVAPHEARLDVGAAPRVHLGTDLARDPRPVAGHVDGLGYHIHLVVVGHDSDAGAIGQTVEQQVHGLVGQLDPLQPLPAVPGGLAHGTGSVHHDDHAVGDHHVGQHVGRPHTHAQQHVAVAAERRRRRLHVDHELVPLRPVAAVEVVDDLLDAHRLERRQHAAVQVVPGHHVGSGVHVQGERRQRVAVRVHERVDPIVPEDVRRAPPALPRPSGLNRSPSRFLGRRDRRRRRGTHPGVAPVGRRRSLGTGRIRGGLRLLQIVARGIPGHGPRLGSLRIRGIRWSRRRWSGFRCRRRRCGRGCSRRGRRRLGRGRRGL